MKIEIGKTYDLRQLSKADRDYAISKIENIFQTCPDPGLEIWTCPVRLNNFYLKGRDGVKFACGLFKRRR